MGDGGDDKYSTIVGRGGRPNTDRTRKGQRCRRLGKLAGWGCSISDELQGERGREKVRVGVGACCDEDGGKHRGRRRRGGVVTLYDSRHLVDKRARDGDSI